MGLVLLCLFGLESDTTLGFELDTTHRVKNPGISCTWACIETAGRANGIEKLHGFCKRQPQGPGYCDLVEKRLTQEGVRYISRRDTVFAAGEVRDHELLKTYAGTNSVVVTICAGSPFIGARNAHSILVLQYGDKQVKYWCPNNPSYTYVTNRDVFDKFWSGAALVVLPDEAAE